MRKQLRLIWMLVKMKLSHMMVFRFNFFSASLVDGSMFLLELLIFSTIYANVESIGGWTQAEMIIFIGTFSMINALNMVIYFFGVIQIPEKIIRGDLDTYLTKPMSPLLRLTFENVNPGSLPLVVMSVVIILYGVGKLDVPPSGAHIAGYLLLVPLMTLLWYDMEIILRSITFFIHSSRSLANEVEGSLIELNFRIPGTLYKGVTKFLFYFVFPYGIMSTIPTQMLAGTLTPLGLLYALGIVALFTAFTFWLWRFGLRHYKSASS